MDTIVATPIKNPDEYYQKHVEPKRLERFLDDLGTSIPWVKQWRRNCSSNSLKAFKRHFPRNSDIIRGDLKRAWINESAVVLVE